MIAPREPALSGNRPRLRVDEANAAEVERGRDDAVPQRPQVRDDPQLDLGVRVASEQVAQLDDLQWLDRVAGDPVAAGVLVRLEGPVREPVRDEARRAEAIEPPALDRVDAPPLALEKPLDVLVGGLVV